MHSGGPPKMIVLARGLAVHDYMNFLLELCESIRHTKKAIEARDLLKLNYHPPYIQLRCRDIERVEEARKRGYGCIGGKKHMTITDGIYGARIYLELS